MFLHPRKLTFVSLAIAFALGGIFGNYRPASAAIVFNENAGLYTDDFADASGVAAAINAGVDVVDGTVKLKNAGGTFTDPYLTSGTVTMQAIQPLRIAKWNTLSIVANAPEGTSIKAQIYDDNNHLFRDHYLPGNSTGISDFPIDLSEVPILQCADVYFPGDPETSYMTCNHPGKVIIKFTLETLDSLITPSINSMQVDWVLSQGDLSPSTFAQGDWASTQHDQQGTFATSASNPAIYPAFRWAGDRYIGDAEGHRLVVSDGKLFAVLGYAHSHFIGLDTDNGNELWQTTGGFWSDPYGVISADGTYYGHDFGTDKSYAIDMATGEIKWSYNFYGGHGSEGVLMGTDGTIFVIRNVTGATYSPFIIYAFNPDNTIKWTSTYTPPYAENAYQYSIGNPSLAPDGTIYFSYALTVVDAESPYGLNFSDQGRLVAVDSSDGRIKWDYETGDICWDKAPIVDKDGTIYVAKSFNIMTLNHNIQVVAVNPDGTLKWRSDFGAGDWGFVNVALKSDGNLYGLYSTDSWDGNGDMTVMELSSTDGAVLWGAPAGKSFKLGEMVFPTQNSLTIDGTDGFYYVDASKADPSAEFVRLNYIDGNHDMRWQIPYSYDSSNDKILFSLASQIMDDRGWVYSVLGKTVRDEAGNYVRSQQFAQAFALAPWTLAPSTSPGAIYRGNTITFSVTTSMQQTNPLTDEANKMQVVLDDSTKIPLVYSSTNGDGDTVWTADYTIPADVSFGAHNYTVEANAALVKTDIEVAFSSPATGSENTGLTAAGTYVISRSGTAPISLGGTSSAAPSLVMNVPRANVTYNADDVVGLDWTATNAVFAKYKVSYSADNGTTWTTISDNATSTSLSWTAPDIGTTSGLIKVEGYDASGTLLATGTSGNFTVLGEAIPDDDNGGTPPATDPTVTGAYTPNEAKENNPNIATDMGLVPATNQLCVSGSLIKGTLPSVYYCGKDGKRYVFTNDKAYFSWYPDFSNVINISDADLALIQLGGNITYRPGAKMVKIMSDPKVYAVARGGILRWVSSEAVAVRLYGVAWNTMIDDVPDSFFVNYTLGEPITE